MKTIYSIIIALLAMLTLSCGVVEKLANRDPQIKNVTASRNVILIGDTVTVAVTADDPDEDELTYSWNANGGTFTNRNSAQARWQAPQSEDVYSLEVTVRDKNDGEAQESIDITVISNSSPVVEITGPANGAYLVPTGTIDVQVVATPITYIDKVEFYIADQYQAEDTVPPYSYAWDLSGYSGDVEIKSIAYRSVPGNTWAADSIVVSVQGVVPIP